MIQQKPATDEALVERARKAVAKGDKTMKPILEWDRRGRKPKREPENINYDVPDDPVTEAEYRKAQQILRKQYQELGEWKQVAAKYDVSYYRIWKMANDEYQRPNPAARVVLKDNAIT